MRLTTIGLTAAALLLSGGVALAQGTGGAAGAGTTNSGSVTGSPPSSVTGSPPNSVTGTSPGTTGLGAGNPNYNAGGSAAGANSSLNPSGNSLMNPSPSGSTLAPSPTGR